jgi:hypothetical protein
MLQKNKSFHGYRKDCYSRNGHSRSSISIISFKVAFYFSEILIKTEKVRRNEIVEKKTNESMVTVTVNSNSSYASILYYKYSSIEKESSFDEFDLNLQGKA